MNFITDWEFQELLEGDVIKQVGIWMAVDYYVVDVDIKLWRELFKKNATVNSSGVVKYNVQYVTSQRKIIIATED